MTTETMSAVTGTGNPEAGDYVAANMSDSAAYQADFERLTDAELQAMAVGVILAEGGGLMHIRV